MNLPCFGVPQRGKLSIISPIIFLSNINSPHFRVEFTLLECPAPLEIHNIIQGNHYSNLFLTGRGEREHTVPCVVFAMSGKKEFVQKSCYLHRWWASFMTLGLAVFLSLFSHFFEL